MLFKQGRPLSICVILIVKAWKKINSYFPLGVLSHYGFKSIFASPYIQVLSSWFFFLSFFINVVFSFT